MRRRLSRIGRALRYLAGVDEDLLDRVRQERARYAALGGAVLGTAAFAAVSMWFAIGEVLDGTHLGALVLAVLWFLLILNLDRWIVTSQPGEGWRRLGLLVARALVAVLFGIVIAEPLVMKAFESRIEESVRSDRAQNLAGLEGRLQVCNPDPTDAATTSPGDCTADETISFGATAKADVEELAALRATENQLQSSIDADSATLRDLNAKARAECVGDEGPGLTGIPGEGAECLLLRGEARSFEQTHPLADRTVKLEQTRARILELEKTANVGKEDFEAARQAEITRRLADETQVNDPIGLLERMEGLQKVAAGSDTLATGIIFIRLLFITMDLTPALLKFIGGKTAYEQIVSDQLRDVIEANRVELAEQREDRSRSRQRHLGEQEVTDRIRLAQTVDRLAEAYEQSGLGRTGPRPPSSASEEKR